MGFIEIVEEEETFELFMGETKFTLRRFDSETYKDIERKHTKRHKNFRQGGFISEIDDYAVNEDLLDYMIVGWEGVKSPTTGQDVPCTREMKLKLPNTAKVQIVEACDADSITTGGEKKTTTKHSESS